MTRLKRITNKIFGNTASTTGSPDTGAEIGQFGSAKAGTYNATADVETIQALPAYEQGWIGAVIPDQQYPTLPEMTGVNKVLSYQTGYLMQEGIPEWDSGTTYYKNSIVKYAKVTTTQTTTASIGASTGITSASVNKNTFVSQISVDGNYTFTYNGTLWLYNGIATDLNIYGITYTGNPAENDTITVTLTTTTSIGDLALYKSLTDDNTGNNPTAENSIHWEVLNLGGAGWTPSLLQPFWSDHELDRMDMLRADTFSWQSGTTYSAVYNLLLEALGIKVQMYCWSQADGSNWFWTLSETPQAGDRLYGWGDEYVTCDVGTVNNVVDNNTIYLTTVLNPNDGSVVTFDTNFTRNSSKDKQSYTCHFERFNGITVYINQRPNGLKIAMPNQEQAILNLYNTTGVAWYYILDKANHRFKLPRTKYGFVGLRDSVGWYVSESLPNIKGSIENSAVSSGQTGAFASSKSYSSTPIATTSSSSTVKRGYIDFNASNSSSTYQDDAPVQQRATQMYLYFYAGEYTQTAIEQTAGLNAELFNGKVDLNASNLNAQGRSYVSGLGMPSSKYINLTLGASGSTYTAPANGWLILNATANNSSNFIQLKNQTSLITSSDYGTTTTTPLRTFLPVKTSNVINITYAHISTTNVTFRFIYAEGENN